MKFASMTYGDYTVEHNTNTDRFDIYKKGEKDKWISLTNATACKNLLIALNKNEGKEEEVIDKAITDELERLNSVPENRPANRNSLLETPLSRATKDIIIKLKGR